MLIQKVLVRYFKAFNFDYLRRADERAEFDLWDTTATNLLYPFVRVPLEPGITTIVGANESGKTQILDAIEIALTGEGITSSDFCRYSRFFDTVTTPDFGLVFGGLVASDKAAVTAACGLEGAPEFESFAFFRFGGDEGPAVFLREGASWKRYPVVVLDKLVAILPKPFRIDSQIPLPDSVPLDFLIAPSSADILTRRDRHNLIAQFFETRDHFLSLESITSGAAAIFAALGKKDLSPGDQERRLRQCALARTLLVDIAKVSTASLKLLRTAEAGSEGFTQAQVADINDKLRRALNFPKWWSQDPDLRLEVELRELDLVFIVRDRTGQKYSLDERSGGLKYFLSYFVTYLAHQRRTDVGEVLLMDEPDAYLSSLGQQDLLRIFEAFAEEIDDVQPCQVVYVTHSPFLIDKNHYERIRVLQKGAKEEGTRVVKNVARNHYEPLRSAFGSFVGEAAFIGNCNYVLEGPSDQILLAGVSSWLRRSPTVPLREALDLNSITLVPAGSASQVPYVVFLARGRDVDKPSVVVLLDSDTAGNEAHEALRKGIRGKRFLEDRFVLQVGQLSELGAVPTHPAGLRDIEDLVPLPLLLAAAGNYVEEFVGLPEAALVRAISPATFDFGSFRSTHAAIEARVRSLLDDSFHLDKVGLARNVIAELRGDETEVVAGCKEQLSTNFRALFRRLGELQRRATREGSAEQTQSLVDRVRQRFLEDHPSGATREAALDLIEEIQATLEDSVAAEDFKAALGKLSAEHSLGVDPTEPITDFGAFRDGLISLMYLEVQLSQEGTSMTSTAPPLPAPAAVPAPTEMPPTTEGEHGTA